MKINIRKLLVLALPFMLLGCSDDNSDKALPSGGGNPVISVSDVQPARLGDSITVNVNCSDNSVALSTLKASLRYSDEEVENLTIRTKENGNYAVRLYVPIYKDIPDGQVTLHLTLQNVQYKTTEADVPISVSRPKYDHLTMHVNDSTEYTMLPDADNPYLFRCTVHSPKAKAVNAYIIAPAVGSNGNEVVFGQGNVSVTQGTASPIAFTSTRPGDFECTFNTLTYAYTPVFDPATQIPEIAPSNDAQTLTQGEVYTFSVNDYYVNPSFFTNNGDGTYTFNAITGYYLVQADDAHKYLQVRPCDDSGKLVEMSSDPQKADQGPIYIIGTGFGLPSVATNEVGWTPAKAVAMAQVKPNVHEITAVVGQEIKSGELGFQFYGFMYYRPEFKGSEGAAFRITSSSDVFGIAANGKPFYKDGADVKNGDTLVITVDLTKGVGNGVLTVTKK